jgi:hypothetical protein
MNKLTFIRTLSALFAIALAACAPVEAAPNDQPVAITLTRSMCFGFCPAYTVTITGDGRVTYVGHRFVNVVGQQQATIPRTDVQRLLARFDAIGFERLSDEYRAQVTDLPTYTITLTRNGRTKRVADYMGTAVGMPEGVRDLEDEIDRVAGTARWVLRDGRPVRDRPQQ